MGDQWPLRHALGAELFGTQPPAYSLNRDAA
jgi:hypothetical protein